jgi:peptidoglycan hydrolase-like protein with peptidoglycan-binding domain
MEMDMTRRSAGRPKKISGLEHYSGVAAQRAGAFVSENPALVGGSTAFAVTMFFIASNALWYQPNAHRETFFQTRSLDAYKAPELPQNHSNLSGKAGGEATFRIVRESAPEADPVVRDIQSALREMAMYEGEVDGIAGPRTLQAIRDFQARAGLEPNGKVGAPLLDAIRTASVPAPKLKKVAPAEQTFEDIEREASGPNADTVKSIQAALKKHGHDEIEPDGIAGSKTAAAIKEYQKAKKLKVTGVADEALVQSMKKSGWL